MLVTGNNPNTSAEQLFVRFGGKMYFIAMKILNDPHDSEDAVMDAFRRIIKNSDKFTHLPPNEADALASVYVKNAAIDIYNSNKKSRMVSGGDDCLERCGADPQEAGYLSDAMRDMPYGQAAVIILKYHYGYTSSEIGTALGISAITVRKRLERAKKQLRQILKKEGIKL